MPIRTLAELFLDTARRGKPDHLLAKTGDSFQPISTAELADRVRRLAHALQEMGVEPGDRVALMADNGPHWPTIDFAALTSGAVSVPIYPTVLPEQAAYIARDSGAKIAFVHTSEQLEGFLEHRDSLPDLEQLVLIEGTSPQGDALSLDELLERGGGYDAGALDEHAGAVDPEDLATLVYTSGTTGEPKGVMLSHHNICSNILTAIDLLDIEESYTALSFLPLSHVFERTIDYAYFYKGVTIAYAESVQKVAENFREVRPHIFVSVPRVYEKVLAKVRENVMTNGGVKQTLFEWAESVGREALPWRLKQEHPPGLLGVKLAIADGLVFRKIKDRLGGRFEFACSGGAPLAADVAEFFWAAGMPIFEGYGLTETSPVISFNVPGHVKLGTVGQPIDGVEVRIAEDGEILARGPNIMQGYYNKPEATAEAIDEDGWFHTGDIGELDDDGYLLITDRKKEIIVNAYGKNVAPAPIENALKASRWVNQVVVIGDRQKYLSALIVPDFEQLEPWASKKGIEFDDRRELVARDEVRELFDEALRETNEDLAHYEQIQRFRLLPRELTLEEGELTPTQKVKRRVVHENWADEIDALYAEERAD